MMLTAWCRNIYPPPISLVYYAPGRLCDYMTRACMTVIDYISRRVYGQMKL